MSARIERARTIESGSPLAKHSLNQRKMYNAFRMEQKAFGRDRKKEKSQRRKLRHEQFMQNFPIFQFDRALGHVLGGKATMEELNLIDKHERVVDEYQTEKGSVAIISIVDFTRERLVEEKN